MVFLMFFRAVVDLMARALAGWVMRATVPRLPAAWQQRIREREARWWRPQFDRLT